MQTPFREILKQAVDATPGAVGAALAASDGELVDSWTLWDTEDWAILTAHYGIVLQQLSQWIHTFHFGDVNFVFLCMEKIALAMQAVDSGYFVILATTDLKQLASLESNLAQTSLSLLEEMR